MLISFTEILAMDKNAVVRALSSDFKDALQNCSAEANREIDIIITRNVTDYKNSNLAIMTPDSYLKMRIATINK